MNSDEIFESLLQHFNEQCKTRAQVIEALSGVLQSSEIAEGVPFSEILRKVLTQFRNDCDTLLKIVTNFSEMRPRSLAIIEMKDLVNQLVNSILDTPYVVAVGQSIKLVPVGFSEHNKKASLFLKTQSKKSSEWSPIAKTMLEIGPSICAHETSFHIAQCLADLSQIAGSPTTSKLRSSVLNSEHECVEGVFEKATIVAQLLYDLQSIAENSIEIRDLNPAITNTSYDVIYILLQCKLCDQPTSEPALLTLMMRIEDFRKAYSHFKFDINTATILLNSITDLCTAAKILHTPVQKCTQARFLHQQAITDYLKSAQDDPDLLIAQFRSSQQIPPSLWKVQVTSS